MISYKKYWHKQFFLKTVELWVININVVWKTTIVFLSVCRAFFSYNVYLRDKSRSFFAQQDDISLKKSWHKQFFLKTVELWGINVNVVAKKTTIVPLSVCRAFFSHNLYLRDKSRSFFAPRTIFCKKCLHKQFFLKTVALWDININAVRKTTIVSLSVCRAFFSYNVYLRDKSHSSLAQQDEFLSRNPDISNFFSKWRNAGV